MPAIPYLTGGEEVTAARLNTLYEEADRRATLALDNHSFLYLVGESASVTRTDFEPFLGPTFIFKSGPQPISGYWGTWSYNHEVFERALASASELTYPNAGTGIGAPAGGWPVANEAQKWVRINPLAESYFTEIGKIKRSASDDWRNTTALLRFSLEAHKRPYEKEDGTTENFWIEEMFPTAGDTDGEFAFPALLQRIRQFEQAEIIFEGTGGTLDFSAKWNKYLFLRFHNINSGDLTVNFRSSADAIVHTITVPAYGSKCVRRTAPEGTYTNGYNHFQKFLAGDPRFYQHRTPNNVANPSIVIPFVNRLLAGRTFIDSGGSTHRVCIPMAELDPHVRAPLPSGYGTLFAAAADDSKLGDNLHHKGTLREINTGDLTLGALSFTGYGGLSEIFETQEVGDDLQIKSRNDRDIIAFSTNLICTEAGSSHIVHPVIDGSQWHTLDRHMPSQLSVRIVATETDSTVSYREVAAGGGLGTVVNQTITRTTASFYAPEAAADTLRPHIDTIAGAKHRYFDQSASDLTTFSTTAQLSAGGLVLLTTQTIPLTAPFVRADVNDLEGRQLAASVIGPIFNYNPNPNDTAIQDVLLNNFTIEDQNLVIKRAIVFTDYGFPDCDNWFYTGFLTPRYTRIYSDSEHTAQPTDAGPHPDFDEGAQNSTGEDIKLVAHRAAFQASDIQILSPREEGNDYTAGEVGILANNDVLFGATKNSTTAGYWTANRDRLLQNRIYHSDDNDGSTRDHNPGFPDARWMYRFVRMELAVEHYNNMAAKVNSIARYNVLNWIDHGVVQNGSDQTTRYRLRPNRDGIFERILITPWYLSQSTANRTAYLTRIAQFRGMRPADQFAGIIPQTSTTTTEENPLYLVATYAGIRIRTMADLPDNFATVKAARSATSTLRATGGIVVTDSVQFVSFSSNIMSFRHRPTGQLLDAIFSTSSTEGAGRVRADLDAITEYRWLSADDVQAYAEGRGYKFKWADIGPKFDLSQIDVEEFEVSLGNAEVVFRTQNDDTLQFSGSIVEPHQPYTRYATQLIRNGGSSLSFDVAVSGTLSTRFVEFTGNGSAWIAGTTFPFDVVSSIGADVMLAPVPDFTVPIPRPADYLFVEPVSGLPSFNQTVNVFHHPLDFTVEGATARAVVSDGFRKFNWTFSLVLGTNSPTVRNPADYTTSIICEQLEIVKRLSSGITDSTTTIEIPIPWLKFTPEFSETSTDAATARATHGTTVLPFAVEPADGEANRVMLWADFTQEA